MNKYIVIGIKGLLLSCLFSILFLTGCSTAKKEVEADIEKVLKIDIPSDFILIDEDSTAALGDYSVEYIVQYKQESFDRLLRMIDLNKWQNMENNNYRYEIHNSDRSSETILLWINERQLKYLYSDE